MSIKIADIDFALGTVKVTGKGQKERIIPFYKKVRKELLAYIKQYRPELCAEESPYLFPTSDCDHVSVNSVQQFIRRLAKKAGLNSIKCSPHSFRHTFATMFIAKGGSGMILKEILGHESFQTTQKYLHLQPYDLQQQHAKYSPVSELFEG